MHPDNRPLILGQRVVKRANADLLCRETSLQLSSDQGELILSRYLEHYSPEGVQWVERSYRVPVTSILKWMIAHGEPHTLTQGNDT
jgi:hypothetical protein